MTGYSRLRIPLERLEAKLLAPALIVLHRVGAARGTSKRLNFGRLFPNVRNLTPGSFGAKIPLTSLLDSMPPSAPQAPLSNEIAALRAVEKDPFFHYLSWKTQEVVTRALHRASRFKQADREDSVTGPLG